MNRPSLSASVIIYLLKLLLVYWFWVIMLLSRIILILVELSFWRKYIIVVFFILRENAWLNLWLMRGLRYSSLVIILNINLILCGVILDQSIILSMNIIILKIYFLLIFIITNWILTDLLIYIWIWIFSCEESGLGIINSFSSFKHSLLWCWTFTLCKMHNILYSCTCHITWNHVLLL